jgi:hypothetical protein
LIAQAATWLASCQRVGRRLIRLHRQVRRPRRRERLRPQAISNGDQAALVLGTFAGRHGRPDQAEIGQAQGSCRLDLAEQGGRGECGTHHEPPQRGEGKVRSGYPRKA